MKRCFCCNDPIIGSSFTHDGYSFCCIDCIHEYENTPAQEEVSSSEVPPSKAEPQAIESRSKRRRGRSKKAEEKKKPELEVREFEEDTSRPMKTIRTPYTWDLEDYIFEFELEGFEAIEQNSVTASVERQIVMTRLTELSAEAHAKAREEERKLEELAYQRRMEMAEILTLNPSPPKIQPATT